MLKVRVTRLLTFLLLCDFFVGCAPAADPARPSAPSSTESPTPRPSAAKKNASPERSPETKLTSAEPTPTKAQSKTTPEDASKKPNEQTSETGRSIDHLVRLNCTGLNRTQVLIQISTVADVLHFYGRVAECGVANENSTRDWRWNVKREFSESTLGAAGIMKAGTRLNPLLHTALAGVGISTLVGTGATAVAAGVATGGVTVPLMVTAGAGAGFSAQGALHELVRRKLEIDMRSVCKRYIAAEGAVPSSEMLLRLSGFDSALSVIAGEELRGMIKALQRLSRSEKKYSPPDGKG